jgi:hypothetical protein
MPSEGHLTGDHDPLGVESDLVEGYLLKSLPFLSEQLGLQGLACLSVSSTTFRDACNCIVRNDAAMLVTNEAQQLLTRNYRTRQQ